jgi:hypothetical protein
MAARRRALVIDRLKSYCEVSPSQTGAKTLLTSRAADPKLALHPAPASARRRGITIAKFRAGQVRPRPYLRLITAAPKPRENAFEIRITASRRGEPAGRSRPFRLLPREPVELVRAAEKLEEAGA